VGAENGGEMIIVTESGIHDDFAQVLCVDSDDIDKISENVCLIHNSGFIMGLLDKKGDHALIVRLELKSRHSVVKHIEKLLQRFDSVSWVRDDKFYTRRKT
jgi:hypothetical protein